MGAESALCAFVCGCPDIEACPGVLSHGGKTLVLERAPQRHRQLSGRSHDKYPYCLTAWWIRGDVSSQQSRYPGTGGFRLFARSDGDECGIRLLDSFCRPKRDALDE